MNKYYLHFFTGIMALGIFALPACKQQCADMPVVNTGAIAGEYDFGSCFFFANSLQGDKIIRNRSEFIAFRNEFLGNCSDTANLASIDFDRNILLGINTQTTACNVGYRRVISIDTVEKVYRYTVTVNRCGPCRTKFRDPNFVLGPPLPAGFRFEIQAEYVNTD
jgi:hypothetical protein